MESALAAPVLAGACFAPAVAPAASVDAGTEIEVALSAAEAGARAEEALVLAAADCRVAPEVAAVDRQTATTEAVLLASASMGNATMAMLLPLKAVAQMMATPLWFAAEKVAALGAQRGAARRWKASTTTSALTHTLDPSRGCIGLVS